MIPFRYQIYHQLYRLVLDSMFSQIGYNTWDASTHLVRINDIDYRNRPPYNDF